jgi:hypothetical protein
MADNNRTSVHENAARIIGWLLEHRTEFEQGGVEESSLAGSIGLSEDEVREAIDHLESHEDVARVPEAISDHPQFLLKPARGWQEIVERPAGEKQASGNV